MSSSRTEATAENLLRTGVQVYLLNLSVPTETYPKKRKKKQTRSLQLLEKRRGDGACQFLLRMIRDVDDGRIREEVNLIDLASVAFAFRSVDFPADHGIVLLAARHDLNKTNLPVVCWRFAVSGKEDGEIVGGKLIDFFNERGDFRNKILNAALPAGLAEAGTAVKAFIDVGLRVGERVPFIAPACALLYWTFTIHGIVQSNKSDLISLVQTWRQFQEKISDDVEVEVGQHVLALAEFYFSKANARWRDAKEVADAIRRLQQRIQSAVNVELLDSMNELRAWESFLSEEMKTVRKAFADIGRDTALIPDIKHHTTDLKEVATSIKQDTATLRDTQKTAAYVVGVALLSYLVYRSISPEIDSKSESKCPGHNFPFVPPLHGRREEFQLLKDSLDVPGSNASVIGGLGMGTSHLAATYASAWFGHDPKRRFGFWFTADTEENLRLGYIEALKILTGKANIRLGKKTITEVAALLAAKLEYVNEDCEWLMVFDDVPGAVNGKEGPAGISQWFFPSLERVSRGRIIWTPQVDTFGGQTGTSLGHISPIRLAPFGPSDSLNLLREHNIDLRGNQELNAARELVSTHLGGVPLAIVTAAKTIRLQKEGPSVSKYVSRFNFSDVHGAVEAVLSDSLERARQNGLGGLLDVIAFVDPARIQLELLDGDAIAAEELRKRNLLEEVDPGVFSIHKLHQEAARRGRPPVPAAYAIGGVLGKIDLQNSSTWSLASQMIPHAHRLIFSNFASGLSTLEEEVGPAEFKTLIEIAHLSGDVLFITATDLRLSRLFYEVAWSLEQQVVTSGVTSFATRQEAEDALLINSMMPDTLTNLANAQIALGDCEEAVKNLLLAMEYYDYFLQEPLTEIMATPLSMIGVAYRHLSDYKNARAHSQRALNIYRQLPDPDRHAESIAKVVKNIGNIDFDEGDFDAAFTKFKQAAKMLGLSGDEASVVDKGKALESLGYIEATRGLVESARGYYDRALAEYFRAYGQDAHNPDIAGVQAKLGDLCTDTGDAACAYEMYTAAIATFQESLGPGTDHDDIAMVYHNVGRMYDSLDDYETAEWYYNKALKMFGNPSDGGYEKPSDRIAKTFLNLGSTYVNMERYDEAERCFRRALSMFEKVFGHLDDNKNNLYIQQTKNNLQAVNKFIHGRDGERETRSEL